MQQSFGTDPDLSLIQAHIAGDTSAFNAIVGRYERMIYNMAYRFTGNAADASDLTQDIFIQLHRKASGFRGESAFSTWFYRLAINRCKDWAAKSSRQPVTLDIEETVLPDGGRGPSALYEQKELQELVQSAIDSLPEEHRSVVILHDIQGHSYEDMAAMLEIPLGTVKSRLARARMRLAEILAPYGNKVRE